VKCVAKSFEYCKEHNPAFDIKNVKRLGFMYSAVDQDSKNVQEFVVAVKDALKVANYKEEKTIFPAILMAHTGGDMFAFVIEYK
ncbi:MAG: hypothetical protein HUJ52_02560, partial [Malacoplasma sp.]|nr:hypothetical protein [Malacoplasma sp.]